VPRVGTTAILYHTARKNATPKIVFLEKADSQKSFPLCCRLFHFILSWRLPKCVLRGAPFPVRFRAWHARVPFRSQCRKRNRRSHRYIRFPR